MWGRCRAATKFVFQKDRSGCSVKNGLETIQNKFQVTSDLFIGNWHRVEITCARVRQSPYKACTLPRDSRWAPLWYNRDLFKFPLCHTHTHLPTHKLASLMQSVTFEPGFPSSRCITLAPFPLCYTLCLQRLLSGLIFLPRSVRLVFLLCY